MNICESCEMRFSDLVGFNEHKALSCTNTYLESYARPLDVESSEASAQRIVSSGRNDLAKREYVPMGKDVKAQAVSRGQARLGSQHFFGGSL